MSSRDIIMAAAGVGGRSYWIDTITKSGSIAKAGNVALDNNNNVYSLVGYANAGNTPYRQGISKLNSLGATQFELGIGGSDANTAFTPVGIGLDSSGNIYTLTSVLISGQPGWSLFCKYNSSGTLQWQRGQKYNVDSAKGGQAYSLHVTSNGTMYCGCLGDSYTVIFAISSSGTLLWSLSMGISYWPSSIKTDSSGNVYFINDVSPKTIVKLNSSGVVQWQKSLSDNSGGYNSQIKGLAIDSSDNLIVVGCYGTYTVPMVVKLNSSGVVQWTRTISSITDGCLWWGVTTDAAGNIYCMGNTRDPLPRKVVTAKYSSDGTLQWIRSLQQGSRDCPMTYDFNNIKADASGGIVYTFTTATSYGSDYQTIVANLPSDGSKTGTYGDFTYSSLTGNSDSRISSTSNASNWFSVPTWPLYTPTWTANTPGFTTTTTAV